MAQPSQNYSSQRASKAESSGASVLTGTKIIHGLNTHRQEMPSTVVLVDTFLSLMLQSVFLPPLRGTVIVGFLLMPNLSNGSMGREQKDARQKYLTVGRHG